MKLKFWLCKHNVKIRHLAKEVGICSPYLSMITSGHRKPTLKTAKLISEATEGEVSPEEIINPENFPDPF